MLYLAVCFCLIDKLTCLPKSEFFLVETEDSQPMQETQDYEDMNTDPGNENLQWIFYKDVIGIVVVLVC